VTIATNMAGRTDIKLSPEVKAAGGLAIIGTERHDSRRVDRQLRGRAGRRATWKFAILRVARRQPDAPLWIRKGSQSHGQNGSQGRRSDPAFDDDQINRARTEKVEENNFGVRKRLLEYDDVMNAQREVVYKRRRHALHGERLKVDIANMMYDTCELIAQTNKQSKDYKNFEFELIRYFSITSPVTQSEFERLSETELTGKVYKAALAFYTEKTERSAREAFPIIKNVYEDQNNHFERIVVPFTDGIKSLNVVTDLKKAYETEGRQLIADFEKNITLAIVDEAWKKHLRKMDELKQSVQLAVHEQKDPAYLQIRGVQFVLLDAQWCQQRSNFVPVQR
jgi:preprotein translocase subunit SecA